MYNCQKCRLTTAPGTSQKKVVVQKRAKQYPVRLKANRNRTDDNGGLGAETVREIAVCPACASLIEKSQNYSNR